jgi:hypothetical protein
MDELAQFLKGYLNVNEEMKEEEVEQALGNQIKPS